MSGSAVVSGMEVEAAPFPPRPIEAGSGLRRHGNRSAARRGFLLSPYSPATERMAWGQVRLLRKYNPEIPVLVYCQDYVPTMAWRGVAEVQTARGCHSGKDDLRWLNKLEAVCDSPFEETIFFDADMISTGPVSGWFDLLGTDDVSFWQYARKREDSPDAMSANLMNPHRFCPYYGVEAVPVMLGGGHYFVRKSGRAQAILDRIASIMVEAMEDPRALYWEFAGKGNLVGDEPAASMAVVEMGIRLPPPLELSELRVGCFMPPWQTWVEADFDNGIARYHCQWARREVAPCVVHFAGTGKDDRVYKDWLGKCAAE